MPADSPADNAVRAHKHVHVEVGIHLQCAQDNDIQRMGGTACMLPTLSSITISNRHVLTALFIVNYQLSII